MSDNLILNKSNFVIIPNGVKSTFSFSSFAKSSLTVPSAYTYTLVGSLTPIA